MLFIHNGHSNAWDEAFTVRCGGNQGRGISNDREAYSPARHRCKTTLDQVIDGQFAMGPGENGRPDLAGLGR